VQHPPPTIACLFHGSISYAKVCGGGGDGGMDGRCMVDAVMGAHADVRYEARSSTARARAHPGQSSNRTPGFLNDLVRPCRASPVDIRERSGTERSSQ
jgi:hypothetical protein